MRTTYFNKQTKNYMQRKMIARKSLKALEYTVIALLGYVALVLIAI